jgi:hypothetical protein
MSETIRLEVAAAPSAFTPVRLVLGGLGTRLEFSVEQLEDLYLATEHLFRAVLRAEKLARFGVEMRLEDGALWFAAGPFTSPALREEVEPAAPDGACLDLCRLLHTTCDEVRVTESDGAYRVVLVKSRRAPA